MGQEQEKERSSLASQQLQELTLSECQAFALHFLMQSLGPRWGLSQSIQGFRLRPSDSRA
jgi:hypothetical protein